MATRLLHEPLVKFLALGGGLFLLFGAVGDRDSRRADRIVVSAGQIESLAEGWMRTWRRSPTSEELDGLIAEHIREEILYREALAMGLDRDDTVVRRRLRQKMEFIGEDAAVAEPTEEELRAYLASHADAFRSEQRISFAQVYLDRDRRGESALRDAEGLLARLDGDGAVIDPAELGDPLLLPHAYESLPASELARLFGQDFAEQLAGLPTGRWVGPVESAYGLHLVLIRQRGEGAMPGLEEVRDAVRREWQVARREESGEELYRRLRERYTVAVERPGAEGADDPSATTDIR